MVIENLKLIWDYSKINSIDYESDKTYFWGNNYLKLLDLNMRLKWKFYGSGNGKVLELKWSKYKNMFLFYLQKTLYGNTLYNVKRKDLEAILRFWKINIKCNF